MISEFLGHPYSHTSNPDGKVAWRELLVDNSIQSEN